MSNKFKDSELATNRVIELDQKGELYHNHAVEIFNHLAKSLNVLSVTDAAKVKGISPQAITKRLKTGKESVVNVNGKTMVAL